MSWRSRCTWPAKTTDLPVVAEVTFGNDGITVSGAARPAEVAHALAALGVDVAGVNCSVGPARVLEFVRRDASGRSRRCACRPCPTPGFPFRSGDRMIYASSPGYFTEHVPSFLDSGVSLLGGCCGTTPAHIQAMRAAVNDIAGRTHGSPAPSWRPVPMVRVSSPVTTEDAEAAPEPTGLSAQAARRQVRGQRRGRSAARVQRAEDAGRRARSRVERGADAVNVADSPMAHVRMGALALCVLIQQQVGIETILHYTTRDRSLMGLQSDLIGAHALGVRNIIALTGDPPSLGDQPESTAVYDVDSIGLVQAHRPRSTRGSTGRASRSATARRSRSRSPAIRPGPTWSGRWIASIARCPAART